MPRDIYQFISTYEYRHENRPLAHIHFLHAALQRPLVNFFGFEIIGQPRLHSGWHGYYIERLVSSFGRPSFHELELSFNCRGSLFEQRVVRLRLAQGSEPFDIGADWVGHVEKPRHWGKPKVILTVIERTPLRIMPNLESENPRVIESRI